MNIQESAQAVQKAISRAVLGMVNRERLAELVVLGAVAGEHLLVIGPPGTAKSQVVRRVAQALGGNYFEYLLGRFTEPNEIFGPVDLNKLREGTVAIETSDMLPEADIAFLDEVFLGSTAILNTLLGILNERIFTRGHTRLDCPLRICVGASNNMPEDITLAAFADRFLLHVFLEPLPDALLEELLSSGWSSQGGEQGAVSNVNDLDVLAQAAKEVDLDGVRPHLAEAVRLLRRSGLLLTDRRIVRAQALIAAAAVIDGRTQAEGCDLWPLIFAIPTREGQELGRELLAKLLAEASNAALPSAAQDASAGPAARAARIVRDGHQILAAKPEDEQAIPGWHLKLEALAREIDAAFSKGTLPEDLAQLRANLKSELGHDNEQDSSAVDA